jgi:uncharacterized protein
MAGKAIRLCKVCRSRPWFWRLESEVIHAREAKPVPCRVDDFAVQLAGHGMRAWGQRVPSGRIASEANEASSLCEGTSGRACVTLTRFNKAFMATTKAKRHVLFIHGAGAGAHEADSKLAASLQSGLGNDWEVVCPKLPEKRPDYPLWAAQIARACAKWKDPVFFVGHSFGGSMLLKYLSEEPAKASTAGIFIISAPYWGRGGWSGEDFELKNDFASKLPKQAPIFLYQGRDDNEVPFAHLGLYREKLPQARVRELVGRDHQLNDDLSETAQDMRGLA